MLGVIASMSIAVSSCGESDSDEPASGNHAFTVDNVDFDSGRNYCALMPSATSAVVPSFTRPPRPPPVSLTPEVPCSSEARSMK